MINLIEGGETLLITLIAGIIGYVSQIKMRESRYIFRRIKASLGEFLK